MGSQVSSDDGMLHWEQQHPGYGMVMFWVGI